MSKSKLFLTNKILVTFSIALAAACTQLAKQSHPITESEKTPGTSLATGNGKKDRFPTADRLTRDAFFNDRNLYYVKVDGWPDDQVDSWHLRDGIKAPESASMKIYQINPDDPIHCPSGEGKDPLYETKTFELGTSGNKTKWAPKSSYKFDFDEDQSPFLGMAALNLKAMWNDVANMREALAWKMFQLADIPASRHTYARFCLNGRYKGLYSIIEDVDKSFLKIHFPSSPDGNLYKAGWVTQEQGDIGPASLAYRGTGRGSDYCVNDDEKNRSYRLKSKHKGVEKDLKKSLESCNDLAILIERINKPKEISGKTIPFESQRYEARMKEIFDVDSFLRWAAVNNLMGAWDNYWATPSNYFLYNGGKFGSKIESLVASPSFHWIPWDYDNSFGISFWDTKWQYADILNWPATTDKYYNDKSVAEIPLISNLLKNPGLRAYYIKYMESYLRRYFNAEWVENYKNSLWANINKSVFLEADCPTCPAHTNRQFNNDQVYWNGEESYQLEMGNATYTGIKHFVIMRNDFALKQIKEYKVKYGIK